MQQRPVKEFSLPDTSISDANRNGLYVLARKSMYKSAPLCLFVTGLAGAGKSFILEELVKYCKAFSQNIGHPFSDTTIRLTAMTGAAATEIGGRTTQSDFKYLGNRTAAKQEEIDCFYDTRINIIDEISFASYKSTLTKISANLKLFTECNDHTFGKHAIAFFGDFCQLECIGGDSIYLQDQGLYWEQALNCMVELKGTHRYSKCEHMKRIMPAMQNNGLSREDKAILNSRVVNGTSVKLPSAFSMRYATYFNNTRAGINCNIFRSYLEMYHKNATETNIPFSAIVIKASPKWSHNKQKLSFRQQKVFFERCSEADCKTAGGQQRCDPLLCLFTGCYLMNVSNQDVANGIANGTTSTLQKVWIKHGRRPSPLYLHGYWVHCISIEDVLCLELSWHDLKRFKGSYKQFPESKSFSVKFPMNCFGETIRMNSKLDIDHFPVVLNHATTGHKLQGKTLDSLFIAEWSNVRNWAYVVLSRVRTLDGLFLLKPIPDTIDFSPASEYQDMMQRLRLTILAKPEDTQALKEAAITD